MAKDKAKEDSTWQHCKAVHEGNKLQLSCNYCSKSFWGGVYRMKHHLARTRKNVVACTQNPDKVAEMFVKLLGEKEKGRADRADDLLDVDVDMPEQVPEETGERGEGLSIDPKGKRKIGEGQGNIDQYLKKGKKLSQNTLNEMWKKDERERICKGISRCIYANALPFNLVKNPFFIQMIEDVCSYGKGLKPPTYHEIRNTYLKSEVLSVNEKMEVYKKEWKKTGCTIMSDGWTDGKRRSITNFLVNCPKGTVFLKSVDTSGIYKSAENIFKMLDEVVEEIGEENVVQCVTDSAAAYVKAGELLMEKRQHLFWSPCAAHCLDLILEDMGKLPTHTEIVEKCRCITVFIYKHSWVLNLMRTWTKGRELTRPAMTRFATQYLTLQSVMAQRGGLRRMFTSIEWEGIAFSRGVEGKKVANIILSDYTFWEGIKYCIKSTLHLVKVLRLVDGDAKPAMGYIYEAMDRAKEQIARNFGKVKKDYEVFWKIIDERWNLQLHRPLHAAGYYLNPQFHYEDTFHADFEFKRGLYDCIERMVSDKRERILIDQQIDYFTLAEGGFGREMAKETRKIKQPAIWWERYGYDCPTLQKFAIRVLSLTCSATGCERNWSVFDQIHSKRRNRLEQKRLNALVFVKYNLQLEQRQIARRKKDNLDPICLSDLESDDEWITELEEPSLPQSEWTEVNECFTTQDLEATVRQPKKRGDYFQACHETRVRSFPHVEGNFALHVFIPVLLPPAIRKELIPFVRKVASLVPDLHTVDSDIPLRDLCRDDLRLEQVLLGSEFHISLARTVPIRVHQIDSIVSMLRQKLQSQKRYYIDFTKWEVFCNDDQTRTFLSLEVTSAGLVEIRRQIHVLDDIYRRHNLPGFYKNPRPHISLVWALGDISHSLKQVTEGFNRCHGNAFSSQKRIFGCTFNGIECKIGKKHYKISRFTEEK